MSPGGIILKFDSEVPDGFGKIRIVPIDHENVLTPRRENDKQREMPLVVADLQPGGGRREEYWRT